MNPATIRCCIVIGAGGHCRSVLALLREHQIEIHGLYDDAYRADASEAVLGVSLCGLIEDAPAEHAWVLAIGDNADRARIFDRYRDKILAERLIHPSAIVHETVQLGEAMSVFARAYLGPEVRVGMNSLVNTAAVVEHECEIGDHVHVAPGAVLCGRARIGSRCLVGAGAVVRGGVAIADGVTLGAGAVVTADIREPGVYAGVPARRRG